MGRSASQRIQQKRASAPRRAQNKTVRPKNAETSAANRAGVVQKGQMDKELLLIIGVMLLFGLVMVASASSVTALYSHGDSLYFFKKQILVAILGFAAMFVVSKVDYHFLLKPAVLFPAGLITWFVTLAVAFVGEDIYGARRWINVAGFSFQPSELGKIVAVLIFAYFLSQMTRDALNKFVPSCAIPMGMLAVFVLPLLLQPHKSATIVICAVVIIMIYVAGANIKYYLMFLPLIIVAGLFLIFKDGYSSDRIESFFNPFADPQGSGYQAIQSLYAIGSGGLFGSGLGRSVQKHLYIPEPQNDFIFAIICEELGLIGALLVVVLFIALFVRCVKIAMEAPDKAGTLIVVGMTALIMVQAITNIAVVTGVVPVTGMMLPFFSAGGTSLLFTLAGIGIVFNISRQSKRAVTPPK